MFLPLHSTSVLDENSGKLALAFCPSLADCSWENQVAFCRPMCFMITFFLLYVSYSVLHKKKNTSKLSSLKQQQFTISCI